MANEAAKANLADLLDNVQTHLRSIGDAHQRRALLTASATACEKRIEVTVNADGVLIQTRFADDISDLSYDEIAEAMTEAAQAAAAEVKLKAEELFKPLQRTRARLPTLSEIIPGMADLPELTPKPVPAPTSPPNAEDRQIVDTATEFENVEQLRGSTPRPSLADDSW
ncbi:YbaB/EbfC family DNA-binding protein [Nocardia sp. NPDC049149]|uniref:YbaB/EbfC family DNA-binding protein n=1 Tax=Nocardia sp. NPDC049149 TaxID=3364315 RepID=UPI003716F417